MNFLLISKRLFLSKLFMILPGLYSFFIFSVTYKRVSMYIVEEKRVKCNEQFLKYFFGNKRQSIKTFVRIFIENSFVMHSDNQIGYCAFCCYYFKVISRISSLFHNPISIFACSKYFSNYLVQFTEMF